MVKRSDNDSAFKKFLDENKSLKFLLPLLAVLIIAVIILNIAMAKDKNTYSEIPDEIENLIDSKQSQVEVLPQIIRTDSGEKAVAKKDPFVDPMKLVGVVYSSLKSTAIIEWGSYSYIVEKGDLVGESSWKVTDIEKDRLTLESDVDKIVISLDAATN